MYKKDASNIYSYLKTELPECDMLDMCHSETPEEKKTNIIKELQTADSQLKMVIATSALGMGIDVVDTHSVILYGVPKHLTDIIQEIGRVGRDGKSSVAMLLYNSYHLNKVDPDVKEMYKTQNCRRLSLLSAFITKHELDDLQSNKERVCSCCDLCSALCTGSARSFAPIEKFFSSNINDEETASSGDSEATEPYVPDDDEATEPYNRDV
ncbi:ATP-dependent DNA helicase tlh2 [Mizuhopecten yessoensis]|uniref:DNA 3'-5' helicase n=1 Tax=Mizuhopecten yessoensis TaxID=6573 RepID=A0A210QMC8_MIZYE|nr:ATP-dependent DNA helicase tlh2 [Mizuhopecten yessoensis]